MESVHCLFPKCEGKVKIRGLCNTHYIYAYRLVKRNKTTWKALIKSGKALPDRGTKSTTSRWFLNNDTNITKVQEQMKDQEEKFDKRIRNE